MNIDEVESEKGLRFLSNDKPCKSPDEIFNYPGTRHELQQRRVRARREAFQSGIALIKRAIPEAVVVKRRMNRPGTLFMIGEGALKEWQL